MKQYSDIFERITLVSALDVAVVVVLAVDGSVAEVAKPLPTVLAGHVVHSALLLNNPTAADVGAKDTKFQIDPFDVFVAVFLYDFLSNFYRQESAFVTVMVGFLLVMFLTFGWCITGPAKVLETFRALDLRTPRFNLGDRDAAL